MPERPDLQYVVQVLSEQLDGATLTGLILRKPVVLRVALAGDPAGLFTGLRVGSVGRAGHFVSLELRAPKTEGGRPEALELWVNPMLAGVFDLPDAAARVTNDVALIWPLADGRQLRYCDAKQMGKVYLIPAGRRDQVPGLAAALGAVDVLDPAAFTPARFRKLARKRRDQVRVFLMDKGALDAMGNAYADEVLWTARLHPKAWVRQLSDEELDRLHAAIVEVLGDAACTIRRRGPPLKKKLRDFLKVRGRAGQPCPRCQTKLRKAGVRGFDSHFCPACQPDGRGSSVVDWRRLGR